MRSGELGRRRLVVALLLWAPVLLMGCSDGTHTGSNNAFSTHSTDRSQGFAVLRGARRPLPKSLSLMAPSQSEQVVLSRGWPIFASLDQQVWAAPVGVRLCLIDQSMSGETGLTCSTFKHALKHGITSTFLREGSHGSAADRSSVGLVPDGAVRVRVLTPGYQPSVAPVRRNVFVLHDQVPEPPETVELLGRG